MRKQDVMEHIARLKAASPAKVLAAFEPLEEAVEAFFTKDVELERAIGETLYQVAFNYEYRNTVYEHQEVMPAFGTDYPKGYEDARDLFDGGGAWEEMASIPADPSRQRNLPRHLREKRHPTRISSDGSRKYDPQGGPSSPAWKQSAPSAKQTRPITG